MSSIMTTARREAWADQNNVFGRPDYRVKRPRRSELGRAETGISSIKSPKQRIARASTAPVYGSGADTVDDIISEQTSKDTADTPSISQEPDQNEKEEQETNEAAHAKKGKIQQKIPFWNQFKAVLRSPVNVLLVGVSIGIAMSYAKTVGRTDKTHAILVFVFNFLAIVPLAGMLSFATEELALYVVQVFGGPSQCFFRKRGGVDRGRHRSGQGRDSHRPDISHRQHAVQSVVGHGHVFLLRWSPAHRTVFQYNCGRYFFFASSRGDREFGNTHRVCSLKTHSDMLNRSSQKAPMKASGKTSGDKTPEGLAGTAADSEVERGNNLVENSDQDDEDEVGAIDDVSKAGVSREFIGVVVLPIVGNVAEHATAVTVAVKDRMDLAIGVAVGSSLQIALLVLPFTVLLSWFGVGEPAVMSLDFDGFHMAVLFISIILNYVIQRTPAALERMSGPVLTSLSDEVAAVCRAIQSATGRLPSHRVAIVREHTFRLLAWS
ncbi:hypothetical protein MRB53_038475 [Persea americana]|nr:hypothetical protein MRB53_038475 [Persea americana]